MAGLRVLAAAAACGAAALAAATGRWPWHRLEQRAPAPAVSRHPPPTPPDITTTDTLRRGETITHLLARQGVEGVDFAALAPGLDPRRLRAGLVFSFARPAPDSTPSSISVRLSPERQVTLRRAADGWAADVDSIPWHPDSVRIEGGIDNSLYEALDAQVPDRTLGVAERQRLAWGLADVYAWQVDFTRDIQPGDHFEVAFERLVSAGGEVRFSRVLASDLRNGGRSLTAFRFGADDGRTAFYDAAGKSLRRAFLRAPVEFRRISSAFARARYHPVLGRVRRHEGTDYAAAPGTPVEAAGEGVVLRAGRVGGYGNLIELRHRNGITTRYGHLRAFARGIRAGRHVSQGQTIGYVGSTGLATGPHLHYEFRVNGVPRDSRRVNLGNGEPIAARERAAFGRERDLLLALLRPSPTVAVSDH